MTNQATTLVSNEEHAALGELFHDNHIHGRRGMTDIPQPAKLHMIDIAVGNHVASAIRAGIPKAAALPRHIDGVMRFRQQRLLAA